MTQRNCTQFRMKKPDELENELNNLQQELNILKLGTNNSNKIENIQKSIVHIRIVQNQTIKDNLRNFYQGEKHKPKDLRPKQTRAVRRELTSNEKSIQLKKTQRKNCNFPQRTFAIKD
ncbi:unnamed protein product [Adineta steineri]|uniref:Large ribosomal subunit protein uL29 n=1 Tax=Adineta steineri TaxID=433720 RepID=A0A813RT01_9BILA|nr:unnamed protein product [Adineta steineri]CAF0787102.1 unnamed protein product [Adineta steineri]CAF1364491.1 unnamed protein product [Adineta steineri]CAF3535782.1 unnamed protein product [Adineta steineri]CAF3554661.1 unnamed protein product [Adineta steineri]